MTAASAAFLRRAVAAVPSRSSESSSESSAYASLVLAAVAAARFLAASFSSVFFFFCAGVSDDSASELSMSDESFWQEQDEQGGRRRAGQCAACARSDASTEDSLTWTTLRFLDRTTISSSSSLSASARSCSGSKFALRRVGPVLDEAAAAELGPGPASALAAATAGSLPSAMA